MAHPNIAGVQSYHNNGGMILRGPGAEWQGEYPRADVSVYDELGRQGERMLPYYRYLVIWSGLYTVHGGFIDWTNDGLGMLSFSNELWNGGQYFNSPALVEQQRNPNSPIAPRAAVPYFDDFLEFGDQYVEWKAFDHPQFGKVEMGGWKKTQGRVPPRFMNEELCHRNMAFSLYQADEMPQMKAGETQGRSRSAAACYRVRVDFTNTKLTPTILAKAAENNVVRPDLTADLYFDDFLEFGDQYIEWAPYEHPQFGKIEMGGWKKTVGRVPPRFMNEELCHRNMAFSLYQADEMPLMKAGETRPSRRSAAACIACASS